MPRRLIICADGTWNTQDADGGSEPPPTNVVKLARAIRPVAADGTSQIVLYHEGVGNARGLARMLGGAFGWGLSRNVRACYRFLVDNYHPGDELYLFGFSRGAYTVRSLAGMIRNSGLLRSEHAHLIPRAYDLYRNRSRETHPNSVEARAFRTAYAHDVRITLLGVWDSVGALGVPTVGPIGAWSRRRHGFHDVTLSGHVDHAYHALALDERRRPFQPALWEVDTPGQDVEQVWFAGVHANVGGGYEDCGLSDVALEWMMERAGDCGLEFCDGYGALAIAGAHDARLHDSYSLGYRVLGDGRRVVNAPRPTRKGQPVRTCEWVHESVYHRLADVTGPPIGPYLPQNLPPERLTPPPATRLPRRSTPLRLTPELLAAAAPHLAAASLLRRTIHGADVPPVMPPAPPLADVARPLVPTRRADRLRH